MLNRFRNLLTRISLKNLNWGYFLLIFSVIASGYLLFSLYLPLPSPKMPLASEVYDINNNLAATFYIQNRRPISLSETPPFLRQAILAVEDHRFYQHHGINLGRIFKAAWVDITSHRLAEGASTITQQLAKNAYLDQKRNFLRKIKELFYALKLELHLSKDQIFELYLNQIYFGHGAYGLKVAAETYFQKSLDRLNQSEMALLAGLPRGPAIFSPYISLPRARRRILEVLQRMLACGYINQNELKHYQNQPLRLPGLQAKSRPAPFFMDVLQDEVEHIFPKNPGLIYTAGLRIESTLDPVMQKLAEQSLNQRLPRLTNDKDGLIQPQGALIAVDPSNGEIRALIGGTDITKSQFNRVTQAKRQPGSAFKPILYAAALGHGYTLATQIDRAPQTYHLGANSYRPLDENNGNLKGLLSLRNALASSSNVVSVKLLSNIGIKQVINLAERLGITSKLPKQLSLALGSGEVTPWELTTAYIPLANGGHKYTPITIRRIWDQNGKILYQAPNQPVKVLDQGVAYLVTQALTGVFQEGGTASNIHNMLDRPVAGKTGTTQGNRDAWFVGYTPDLLTCIFVACDHNERPLPGNANQVAAPIWAAFMSKALAKKPASDFLIPNNVTRVVICKETGSLATAYCPTELEYFLEGTEPTTYCPKHRFIELEICKRSGCLAGPYCREREVKQFPLGEQPTEICDMCKKSYLLDWFWNFFHGRR